MTTEGIWNIYNLYVRRRRTDLSNSRMSLNFLTKLNSSSFNKILCHNRRLVVRYIIHSLTKIGILSSLEWRYTLFKTFEHLNIHVLTHKSKVVEILLPAVLNPKDNTFVSCISIGMYLLVHYTVN